MASLGVKWENIHECIAYERQGIDNATGMEDLFDVDRAKLLEYGITLTPAVVING